MRDTRTPALVNIGGVAIRLVLDVAFYFVLPIAAVTASLMVGTALSFVAALVMGYWLLRVRLGRLGLAKIADTLARLAGAAAVGGILAFAVSWGLGKVLDPGKILGVVQLVYDGGPSGDLCGHGVGAARAGGSPVRRSDQGASSADDSDRLFSRARARGRVAVTEPSGRSVRPDGRPVRGPPGSR